MLGMYIHMHWAYNHPYAARTWSLEDWHNYLHGLRSLGYDYVMIWPMLDSMPPEPNASDLAFLKKIGHVIRMAQEEMGMKVAIVSCPNTIGNENASKYAFENRPYFDCERKINPADKDERTLLLSGRRNQFRHISHANALVIIDSDPGGYIGSTAEEFVVLMAGQIGVFREMNPDAELIYWMHFGWEPYNQFWAEAAQWSPGKPQPQVRMDAEAFRKTLVLMQERIAEPWSLLSNFNMKAHHEATSALGLTAKQMCFPYGLIEGEPTFPLTNCDPSHIAERIKAYTPTEYPRGFMANAQTHVLQLPHTYLVSHHVLHGANHAPDLVSFAQKVLPGYGAKVARAWEAINSGNAELQHECAQELRLDASKPHAWGPCSGLLLGSPERFLIDLAMNLEVRAGLVGLKRALDTSGDVRTALRRLLADLKPYQQRLGFVDAYGGPLYAGLNQQVARLNDPGINAVLEQFSDWRNPATRHGVLPRLLKAVEEYCALGGGLGHNPTYKPKPLGA